MLSFDRALRWTLTGLLVFLGAGLALASDGETRAAPSLTLSNQDIGLGTEALQAKRVVAKPEQVEPMEQGEKDGPLELSLKEKGADVEASTAEQPEGKAEGAAAQPKQAAPDAGRPAGEPKAAQPAPVAAGPPAGSGSHTLDFEDCMERSIRAGNGYDESARVCRAVSTPPPPELAW